jgi:hypothetical protein
VEWKERGNEPMTAKQKRMLNDVCGCIAGQLHWVTADGARVRLDKDDWRHLFSGIILGPRFLRGWDHGTGPGGFIILGRSSLDMSKTQACEAITMALHFGDHPEEQGIDSKPVRWSRTVLLGTGWNPELLNEGE